jgi:transposase-like protein
MSNAQAAPSKTRTRWTAEGRAEWVRLLEQSGQGLSEFCRENDLSESTVSLWRKQLRESAAISDDEAFIEVELPRQPSAPLPATLIVRLAGGESLSVPVGTDPAWLAFEGLSQLAVKVICQEPTGCSFGHPDAGWRSAVIYSVVGTCKLLNVNPESYLTWVLPKLATATTTTSGGLLPHDYAVLKAH